ncbi:MAG: NADH-quinone oxidoreductase subunit C [Deltaproteobacteria bacterium]|nr:NADH-quinone oxidoreductase subunit C [Deltaproteobacteria bacterium]
MLVKTERDRQNTPIFWVRRERVIDALRALRETDGLEYHFMSDLTAYDDVDGPDEAQGRFVVVYQLYSPQYKTRVRVKTRVVEGQTVPTATVLWEAANWAEREVYDMFGVKFEGHPDLRRILLDVRWQGHPLRKDYHWRKQQLFNDPEPIPEHLLKD